MSISRDREQDSIDRIPGTGNLPRGFLWGMIVVAGIGIAIIVHLGARKVLDDATVQNATMVEQLRTAHPGDIAVLNDGNVVVLGNGGRQSIFSMGGDLIHFTQHNLRERESNIHMFAGDVRQVVRIGTPDHGGFASCFVTKKRVAWINATPTCQ
jgi:hypothetical protein